MLILALPFQMRSGARCCVPCSGRCRSSRAVYVTRLPLLASSLLAIPTRSFSYLTGSVGAACDKNSSLSLEALMRQADAALYEAKSAGVGVRMAGSTPLMDSSSKPANAVDAEQCLSFAA